TMKKLVLLLLAAVMVGAPMGASSQERSRDQNRAERRVQRNVGQQGRWAPAPRIGRQYAAPAPYAVPAPRDIPGRVGAGRFEYEGGYARQYAPARAWGRGQYLPQEYWGGRVMDYQEYRLRQPPYGYGWVAVGKDIYLMQDATGLVLDAVPGAY
ncbi:MAG: RcnB family protein, partial [Caulobacteraceae bacterium]